MAVSGWAAYTFIESDDGMSKYVGLIAENGVSIVAGIFGILKAGDCVVAINPQYPRSRIEFIIHECDVNTIVTDKINYARVTILSKDNPSIKKIICVDDVCVSSTDPASEESDKVAEQCGNEDRTILPDDPCFVIYTSGTTGRPKGVVISHRNFMIVLLWFLDYLGLKQYIRALQNLSYSFDFGMFDILSTMLCGGSLYFVDKKKLNSLRDYVDFINKHEINTLCVTPTFFSLLAAFRTKFDSLRILHLGGEEFTPKHLTDFMEVIEANCKIYNGYGPSECTCNSTIYRVSEKDKMNAEKMIKIPIGRPSANNYVDILDAHNNLVPIGVIGELCVSGDGVGLGYIDNSLNAQKFHDNPYRPGQLSYRSGDLVRWLPDGNIEFVGRNDDQAKINGFRIETGEVETCLLEHPKIKAAAVIIAEQPRLETKYLSAFVVCRDNLTVGDIKAHLQKWLPFYMVPRPITLLQHLPLTLNGKVDRDKLLALTLRAQQDVLTEARSK